MVRKNAGAVKGYLERRDQSRVEVRGNCVLDNTDPRENRSRKAVRDLDTTPLSDPPTREFP
jgi:hypothetical protein